MIVAMTDTAVADQVETTPGAFATSTLAVILSEGRHVTVHAVDGIVPSVDSLTTGSYPYVKDMYMFTSRQPSDAAKQFLEFVRSAQGAEILRAAGHKTD
jgi:phosphate transport system substrate-binding protein